jgi:adenylate cyclase
MRQCPESGERAHVTKRAYQPKPLNTSRISLRPELKALIEKLARNTHEVWAKKRKKDGWTYGPERNDKQKKHPDMVAYEDLTEGEKSYDREVVTQVVKGILALGYGIAKR